jgi:hypothetical protein
MNEILNLLILITSASAVLTTFILQKGFLSKLAGLLAVLDVVSFIGLLLLPYTYLHTIVSPVVVGLSGMVAFTAYLFPNYRAPLRTISGTFTYTEFLEEAQKGSILCFMEEYPYPSTWDDPTGGMHPSEAYMRVGSAKTMCRQLERRFSSQPALRSNSFVINYQKVGWQVLRFYVPYKEGN